MSRRDLRHLWKAELHVHLPGTIEGSLLSRLVEKNGGEMPTVADLGRASRSASEFFSTYDLVETLLKAPEDYSTAVEEYLLRAADDGARWVELSIGFPTADGPSMAEIVHGVLEGFARARMSGGVIASLRRGIPPLEALEQVGSLAHLSSRILAVGIAGAEERRLSEYAEAFELARNHGLRTTAHVGSVDDIEDAIFVLGVDRIDHGFRVLERTDLVDAARTGAIPFTICPITNVQIGPIASLSEHPLPRMLANGLRVSLGSDDPALLRTSLLEAYVIAKNEFGLSDVSLAELALESAASSFADVEVKHYARSQVLAWLDTIEPERAVEVG